MPKPRHKGRRPLRAYLIPLAFVALVFGVVSGVTVGVRSVLVSDGPAAQKSGNSKVAEAAEPGAVLPEAAPASMAGTEESLCEPFRTINVVCTVTFEVSETVPVGGVIEQTPEAGAHAGSVTLKYSKGPSVVTVPILAGLDRSEAKDAVWASGLTLGTVSETDAAATPGTIMGSSLSPSTQVANGTVIDLTYSSGRVKVPNWIGKSREFAAAQARELGLTVNFKERKSEETSGLVIDQSVKGWKVDFEKVVTVFVAKNDSTEATVIPDVIGMSQTEAISLLASEGFLKIAIVTVGKTTDKAVVVKMSPEAGEEVSADAKITITVGKE